MQYIDISREITTAPRYEGDSAPSVRTLAASGSDDRFLVTEFSLCSHSGTHLDAPLHSDEDGVDVTGLKMKNCCGKCTVVTISGLLTGADMERLLPRVNRRLILHTRGKAFLTISAARVIAESRKTVLIGTDALSIADESDEFNIHRELALANIAVLEGLYLEGVNDGDYNLVALPLKFKGLEASPCRAILIDQGKGI